MRYRVWVVALLLGCGSEAAAPAPSETRVEVTVAPERAEPVSEERPAVQSYPAQCEGEPSGLALRLACAGGGRPFLDELVNRAGRNLGPGQARLESLAAQMPDVRAGEDLANGAASALALVVRSHLVEMCQPGADTSEVEAFVSTWTGPDPAGRAALRAQLTAGPIHFNASNGLLGWLVTLSSIERLEQTRARAQSDLGMSALDTDRGLANQLGARLADIVIALTSSPGNEATVARLLFGTD